MPYKSQEQKTLNQKKYYQSNKNIYLSRTQERRRKRKIWYKEIMKDKKCSNCPESSIECLDWHHLDPSKKHGSVTEMLNNFKSLEIIIQEMTKCIILCSNCHRKLHYALSAIEDSNL